MNDREYFAEGVQSWFDNKRENDHDHNHVNTRAELIEYDPGFAALRCEIFGETELKYTKPETLLTGYLEGCDPSKAPSPFLSVTIFSPTPANNSKSTIRRWWR